MSTETHPPVDPLAELVRAAIAWRYRRPGVAESVSALLKAVDLYERNQPTPAPAGTERR
jgi:hypothetical protein